MDTAHSGTVLACLPANLCKGGMEPFLLFHGHHCHMGVIIDDMYCQYGGGEKGIRRTAFPTLQQSHIIIPFLLRCVKLQTAFMGGNNGLFYFFQQGQQLVFCQQIFEDIFICPQLHGFFDIIKIIMTAEHNGHCRIAFLFQPANQLNAIHHRHADVCDDDIRFIFLCHTQGFFPILCRTYQLIAMLFPIGNPGQEGSDQKIVIR